MTRFTNIGIFFVPKKFSVLIQMELSLILDFSHNKARGEWIKVPLQRGVLKAFTYLNSDFMTCLKKKKILRTLTCMYRERCQQRIERLLHDCKCNMIIISRVFHCVKSVQVRSFFWSVFSSIRTEHRKMRTRKDSVFGHFSRSVLYFGGLFHEVSDECNNIIIRETRKILTMLHEKIVWYLAFRWRTKSAAVDPSFIKGKIHQNNYLLLINEYLVIDNSLITYGHVFF